MTNINIRIDPALKALIPPLSAEELALLEESILTHGCRDPLVVWPQSEHEISLLIDGHNRHEICRRHGLQFETVAIEFPDRQAAEDWMDSNQLGRRNLTPDSFRMILGRRYHRQKQSGFKGNQHTAGKDQIDPQHKESTAAKLAKEHAVSEPTVKRAAKFYEEVERTPELKKAVEEGRPVLQVKRELKEKAREQRREENRQKVAKVDSPEKTVEKAKFATIVIDPPWDWGDEGDVNQMGRAKPDYSTMSIDQLAALPVGAMADEDCHLYLWITNRSLPKGFRLIDSWGFRYITAITWVKPHFGMGNYFRGQTEHVLFAVKGSQPLKRKDLGTVFSAPRGKGHSGKPSEFYDLVESASPGPYLELFSRSERSDWVAWGESSAD
jgi:N6-adenosine-specific RNA methylase IME4